MALRLRRGTNADRLTVTPAEGELLYTTDSKKIYAGDGSTVGGNIVSGINNLLEDLTPQLGGDLDLNSKNLVGNGNIDITGSITAPSFTGDFYGSVFGDDSELLVDVINSKIVLSNNILADLSDVQVTDIQSGQVLKWNGNNWYGATDNQVNLSVESLNSLGDVNVDGVQLGQVLAWGGSEWTASNIPSTVNNLTDLTDVTITNPLDNQLLKYNNNTSSWINFSLQLNDIANVSASSPLTNHIIKYNQSTGTWETELLTLSSLADVNTSGLQPNHVLRYNNLTGTWSTELITIASLADVDTTTLLIGDILTWDGFNWKPDGGIGTIRETDIQGSVYGLDSTVLVDAINNNISANNASIDTINCYNFGLTLVKPYNEDKSALTVKTEDFGGFLELIRVTETDLTGNTNADYGTIFFSREFNQTKTRTTVLSGYENRLVIAVDSTSTYDESKHYVFQEGQLSIGKFTPTATLDVAGNGKFLGPVQVGTYATTTAANSDIGTPEKGMIIWVDDDESAGGAPAVPKFLGYNGSAWVPLS